MQHNLVKEHRAVIAFVVTGVFFLVIAILSVLSSNYAFSDKTRFYTEMNDALGLKSLPVIYYRGIEIGRVEHFEFNYETQKIRVDFWVLTDFSNMVTKHSILKSELHPIFNEIYSFTLFTPDAAYKDAELYLNEHSLVLHASSEAAKLLATQYESAFPKDDLESIIQSVNTLLTNLQQEDNPHAGSLFRALDRVAKISEQLLLIAETIEQSGIVNKADKTIEQAESWLNTLPIIVEKLNDSLLKVDKLLVTSETVINNYKSPEMLVGKVTNNQLPIMLTSINQNLDLVKGMLSEVHTERAQVMLTIYQSQQVLSELEKTLQALNNNPVLKGGIKEINEKLTVEVQ